MLYHYINVYLLLTLKYLTIASIKLNYSKILLSVANISISLDCDGFDGLTAESMAGRGSRSPG